MGTLNSGQASGGYKSGSSTRCFLAPDLSHFLANHFLHRSHQRKAATSAAIAAAPVVNTSRVAPDEDRDAAKVLGPPPFERLISSKHSLPLRSIHSLLTMANATYKLDPEEEKLLDEEEAQRYLDEYALKRSFAAGLLSLGK